MTEPLKCRDHDYPNGVSEYARGIPPGWYVRAEPSWKCDTLYFPIERIEGESYAETLARAAELPEIRDYRHSHLKLVLVGEDGFVAKAAPR